MDKPPLPDCTLSPPEAWLELHGDALYRYAYSRIRHAAQAEDLVQETLLAALTARRGFAGHSSERTWFIGILKNKLMDHLRKSVREQPVGTTGEIEAEIDAMFETDGHWKIKPTAWENPTEALEQKQFWKILTDCLETLPARQAQVFALSEFEGLDGAEICKVFQIAATNVWIMLHRARLRLRECLDNRWFGRETGR
jgi:RNA polymerase sigma-70 factor (ECF subfamily)